MEVDGGDGSGGDDDDDEDDNDDTNECLAEADEQMPLPREAAAQTLNTL